METKQSKFEYLKGLLASDLDAVKKEQVYLKDKTVNDFKESELDKVIHDVNHKMYQEGKKLRTAMNPERALEYLSFHTKMAKEDIKNVMHKATKSFHKKKDDVTNDDDDDYLSLMLMDNMLTEPYIWFDVLDEYKVRNPN